MGSEMCIRDRDSLEAVAALTFSATGRYIVASVGTAGNVSLKAGALGSKLRFKARASCTS